jgi:dUTPase
VTEGDRVAQLILERIVTPEVIEVEVSALPDAL